jgi:hypothetical protein
VLSRDRHQRKNQEEITVDRRKGSEEDRKAYERSVGIVHEVVLKRRVSLET